MARRDARARACIRCILLQRASGNQLYTPRFYLWETLWDLISNDLCLCAYEFWPTYPDTDTKHVHDIAPDPAFLLCFLIQIHCINGIHLDW